MRTAKNPTLSQDISQETSVLIVGGGPVGLSAAVELGQRGVSCIVIEPRLLVSQLRPRAKTTSIRTMEHFRRWGLAARLREAAPLKVEWSQDVVFCTTLLGHEIMRFSDCLGLSPRRVDLYAEAGQQIAQPLVEEVLREAVSELERCQLCLGWSLRSLQQSDDRVRAIIVNAQGEQRSIEAAYVLGCDGSHSVVRASIGAHYVGSSDQRPNFGLVFRAPGLAERHSHGPAVHYWVLNPARPGLLGRMDLEDHWWAITNGVSAEAGMADPRALINGLVGEEIEAEVLGTDPWTARMLLVDRYYQGRVFLAGDAAHLNPPWGGHGFNTGVGDAVNIGWKLAAVLDGWGGARLLASYEAERRSIAARTIQEAAANMSILAPELTNQEMSAPGHAGEQARQAAAQVIRRAKDREFHSLGLVLGYQYDASPVIIDDGTPSLAESQEYTPTAQPGARLPHLWLPDGTSLYDQLGQGLSLLRLREGAEGTQLIEAAAARRVPLRVIDLQDQAHEEHYGAPLLLVRSDQHVAWRGTSVDRTSAQTIIDQIRGA